MSRPLALAACCVVALAACGGEGGGTTPPPPSGNTAARAQFTYGAATTAGATERGALRSAIADARAFSASPSAGAAVRVTNPGLVTAFLLDDPLPLAPGSTFDDPSCPKLGAAGVTFAGCAITTDLVNPDESRLHSVTIVDGQVGWAAATGTLTWELAYRQTTTVTGATSVSYTAAEHESGSYVLTATTLAGQGLRELSMDVSTGVASGRFTFEESVDVNVTYDDATTCPNRLVGGTVEAKRVWTSRPPGAPYGDAAVKLTWNGCATASVEHGTR